MKRRDSDYVNKAQVSKRQRFAARTYGFSLVVCYHARDRKWLAVKEVQRNGGSWWLPAGGVDSGENFREAAVRETLEEAGIDVILKGVLRVEHKLFGDSARMRLVFYAEPKDLDAKPKDFADSESECARWLTEAELRALPSRGPELLDWIRYLRDGNPIYNMSVFEKESTSVIPWRGESAPVIHQDVFYHSHVRKSMLRNLVNRVDDPSSSAKLQILLVRIPELRTDPAFLEMVVTVPQPDRRIFQILFLNPDALRESRIEDMSIGDYCISKERWESLRIIIAMAKLCGIEPSAFANVEQLARINPGLLNE